MNKIREMREAAGLSQAQLSRASGMAQESISRLEAGQDYARSQALGRPRADTLQRLAGPLGCRWWELLDEEDLSGIRSELREELDRVTSRLAGVGIPLEETRRGVDMAYGRTP